MQTKRNETYPSVYDGPVEQHPATARLRAHIAILRGLPQTSERDQALDFAEKQLAAFNAAEFDSRAREILALQR